MLDEDKQMKLKLDFITNLKTKEATDKTHKASQKGLGDVVAAIARDSIRGSPVLTGNNRRSIMYEVGPGKEIARKELEGAVYSTSGYGGLLETGTAKMSARPYFKPALDRNIKNLPRNIKAHLK